ncbi:phosphatase PAP2 family protein [Streptomyces sp. RKAG337]|uniref:phosphatase PAP2 family protein n=1 Tax=Streptomyces sp. RKAG337 TaxID=2893404 RepID=UPI00203364AF|nr:phosphatase PAP2 family protein [Streptomyces sp. RKAG337]MCM2424716.1 phosphatase PAP2 family protein [Streptomyces sp. RKAG337]
MTDTSTAVPELPTAAGDRQLPAAPPRPRVLPLALVCVLATALIGFATRADVRHPFFQGLDERWLGWMGGPHRGLYEAVATVLNWFGGPLGVVVPLALLVALLVLRRWWSVLYLLTTYLAANMLVVQVLKHVVDRPRPAHPLVRVDHGSFPSGHAAGAATLVVIVGVVLIPLARRRAWWLAGGLFVALMMWSRTWLHAHWLSDTVAGALAGAGTSLLLWWAFAPLLARERRDS